jgi:hypothetical protein
MLTNGCLHVVHLTCSSICVYASCWPAILVQQPGLGRRPFQHPGHTANPLDVSHDDFAMVHARRWRKPHLHLRWACLRTTFVAVAARM